MEYPEIVQIEVTNKCNFNCIMCIRHVWQASLMDMNPALFSKIGKEVFPYLKRLDLYGQGEPFMHPNFLDLIKTAREYLPREGEILMNTNGSFLNPKVAERLVKIIGRAVLAFSVDTSDARKLEQMRLGAISRKIFENFRYLVSHKGEIKLGVEAVVAKRNYMDLPELVRKVGEEGGDFVLVSHIVPYTKAIFDSSIYIPISQESLKIMKKALDYGWDLIREANYEFLAQTYAGRSIDKTAYKLHKELWESALGKGYWINLPMLFESKERLTILEDAERYFKKAEIVAHEYGIDIDLPPLLPDARRRHCPYVDKKALFIRSDGKVAPCMDFAYSHPMYVNMHLKMIKEVIMGDLKRENLLDIWNSERYRNFRKVREDMPANIPWCGDCPYSALGCFYTEDNYMDCYGNEPNCAECLYSVDIARCNI